MKNILRKIMEDNVYIKNIEYEETSTGHPEKKIKYHIQDLEKNLGLLQKKGLIKDNAVFWKIKFLIHVHDLFKIEAQKGTPPNHPYNHAFLAKQYASRYTDDKDLLNMIQFHDENYKLWKEYSSTGYYDTQRFSELLSNINDWDIFLTFIIIDGCTNGKSYKKLYWFLHEVKKHKNTIVDENWILPE